MRVVLLVIALLLSACASTQAPLRVEIPVPIPCPEPKPLPKLNLPIYSLKPGAPPDEVIKKYVATVVLLMKARN